jgi:hypothetical protein
MGMPISGVGQVPNQMPSVSPTDFKNIQEAFKEGSKVIDTEVQAFTKDMVGKKTESAESRADTKEVKQQTRAEYLPQLAESISEQMMSATDDVKKKKKKTKFDEMMEAMALLEGTMDLESLSPEQKAQFSELFDNLDRVKKRQRKMKDLEAQEVAMQRAVEAEAEEKKTDTDSQNAAPAA